MSSVAAPTVALEVERKFDVGDEARVPDLSDLPGVVRVEVAVHELEATYLDTPDLRLRGARTTLRRRTGGADEGWHLKLPLGADREEVRLPLAPELPAQLAGLVRSVTRRAPLEPVATLTTHRTVHHLLGIEGDVLAEVADDRVVGRPSLGGAPLRWREWEVELGEGPAALLDEVQARLIDAGAVTSGSASKVGRVLGSRAAGSRDDGAGSGQDGALPWWRRRAVTSDRVSAGGVVHARLAEQVAELVRRDPQVRRDQPEAVHRMRVATRRLRSALQTFRPLLDRSRTDPLRDELAWLAAVLGDVRDTEVMHARLRALVSAQPEELVVGPVQERIDTVLGERYRRVHEAAVRALDSDRYLTLLDALEALVEAPPLRGQARGRAAKVLPALVGRSATRLARSLRAAQRAHGEEQDLLVHEARKDAKRARYAAEAVTAAFGRPARRYAAAAAHVQEVLGEHQDGVVTRAALVELADAAHAAGESSFTYGRLHALEEDLGKADAARLPALRKEVTGRHARWLGTS